jgi:hypothetical protein
MGPEPKEEAERYVVYTYMLVGDILSIVPRPGNRDSSGEISR